MEELHDIGGEQSPALLESIRAATNQFNKFLLHMNETDASAHPLKKFADIVPETFQRVTPQLIGTLTI